jgi:hypothetical protein
LKKRHMECSFRTRPVAVFIAYLFGVTPRAWRACPVCHARVVLFLTCVSRARVCCFFCVQTLECKGKNTKSGTSGELITSLSWIGLDFKETWKTDGTVTSEVSKKDFVEAKASKAVTELVISPTSGLQKVTIKANVEVGDCHCDIKTSGADIPKSLDVGFVYSFLGNWSLGFQASSKDILASVRSTFPPELFACSHRLHDFDPS